MRHLRCRQRATKEISRVVLRPHRDDRIPEDAPDKGTQPLRSLVMSLSLHLAQCVQKLVRRDFRNWAVTDVVIDQVPEPAGLLDGGRLLPFALHLFDELVRNELESGRRADRRFDGGLALCRRWIDAVREQAPGLVALCAGLLERDFRVFSEREFLLDAAKTKLQSPQSRARRLHLQVQTVCSSATLYAVVRGCNLLIYNALIAIWGPRF
jgi:hypothetical protein